MFKYKDGRLMICNMVLLFALAVIGVYIAPQYGVNRLYSYGTIATAVLTIISATIQVMLARKLFRIAKEESEVQSNTTVEDDSEE